MLYSAICYKPLARQVIHKVVITWKSLGTILPAGVVTGYGAKAGRLGPTLPNVPILRPVISVFESLTKFTPGKGTFNID